MRLIDARRPFRSAIKGGQIALALLTITMAVLISSCGDALGSLLVVSHSEDFIPMVAVPAGSFQRDSNASNISHVSAFKISKYEITRQQFLSVFGSDPSDTNSSSGFNALSNPVQKVNWQFAIKFCNLLSLRQGLTPVYAINGKADPGTWTASDWSNCDSATVNWTANGYRLPTTMEWFWAVIGAPGSPQNQIGYTKIVSGYSGTDTNVWLQYGVLAGSTTQPVGSCKPNELGIFDMNGNVWEWLGDLPNAWPAGPLYDYHDEIFTFGNPKRVVVGGSFKQGGITNVLISNSYQSNLGADDLGFRVVRR